MKEKVDAEREGLQTPNLCETRQMNIPHRNHQGEETSKCTGSDIRKQTEQTQNVNVCARAIKDTVVEDSHKVVYNEGDQNNQDDDLNRHDLLRIANAKHSPDNQTDGVESTDHHHKRIITILRSW